MSYTIKLAKQKESCKVSLLTHDIISTRNSNLRCFRMHSHHDETTVADFNFFGGGFPPEMTTYE